MVIEREISAGQKSTEISFGVRAGYGSKGGGIWDQTGSEGSL